jgi:hypothetical protein
MASYRLYAFHDSDAETRSKRGSFPVDLREARLLNADGYGIFWVVNDFEGKRKQANTTRIRFWFCEIDARKRLQEQVVPRLALLPSMVVESKAGHHLYWRVHGEANQYNWRRVVRYGLVPSLGGDPKATDMLRLLRAPGYLHMKDPNDPFMVNEVSWNPYQYTEQQMLQAFPDSRTPKVTKRDAGQASSFWEAVGNLDCRDALQRLGGHWLVNGEKFTLDEQGNGNANIIRSDGYSTGSFVDSEGTLGNTTGGCSIAAWCHWYGHDWGEVARGLKELYPELEQYE